MTQFFEIITRLTQVNLYPFSTLVENREYNAPYLEDEEKELFRKKLRLNDTDYTKENWNHLRIPNFTFVRESEIDNIKY